MKQSLALLLLACAVACGAPDKNGVAPTAPARSAYEEHKEKFAALYAQQNYAAALDEAKAALAASPTEMEPYKLVSKTFIESKQDAAGIDFFSGLTGTQPTRGEPWFFKGFHEARLGKWEDAQASFEKAAERMPEDAEVHFRLGQTLGQRGQVDRAVAELKRAHDLDPRGAGKTASLMVALSLQGKNGEADALAAELLAASPDSAESQYAVAQLRIRQKRWDDAEKALRRAVALVPTFASAHMDLARLLAQTGRKEEAEKELALARPAGQAPASR